VENTSASSMAEQGQTLAAKAAEKSEELRGAIPAIGRATNQAGKFAMQGIDAVSDAFGHARDTVSATSDSVIAYTKKNPVKALALAAGAGALLYGFIKALKSSRD